MPQLCHSDVFEYTKKNSQHNLSAQHSVTAKAAHQDIEMFCDTVTRRSQSSKRDTFIHKNTHFILMLELNLCTSTAQLINNNQESHCNITSMKQTRFMFNAYNNNKQDCQALLKAQGDHAPDALKFPDISLTMCGTHAHVKWYS